MNGGVKAPAKERLVAGIIVLVLGQFAPLFVPLVVAMDWPTHVKSILSGVLLLGIPELAILAAAAILGKEGFEFLRARAFALFRKYGPPDAVSKTRYRIGLVMFLLPLLYGWLGPYIGHFMSLLDLKGLLVHVASDVILITSLFVLGGDFWDKLRNLFIHDANPSQDG